MKELHALRSAFNAQMELLRKAKVATKTEQVMATASGLPTELQTWSDKDLRELLKCAKFTRKMGDFKLALTLATDAGWSECPRCRRYYDALYEESGNGPLCERCDQVMHLLDFDLAFSSGH